MMINRDHIELTNEFRNALKLMEDSSDHLFITGKAGTGKSTLLELFREQSEKSIAVLAPTGIAAINVRGSTIHSFFQFPPRIITEDKIRIIPGRKRLFSALDILIIDEVSMVRADLLDGIDQSLQLHRSNDSPFGGVKMIFIGDLHQLPPVLVEEERNYFLDIYKSEYFFSAPVISEIDLKVVELTKIFRQKDPFFIDLLNKIRDNNCFQGDISRLNNLYEPSDWSKARNSSVWLCSTRKRANHINNEKLETIKSEEYTYQAMIEGRFDEQKFPTEVLLRLKVGAQIMMVKNDSACRWVNGTIGRIESLEEDKIEVRIKDEVYIVDIEQWEDIVYRYDRATKKIKEEVVGSFMQYPLKLAWAITIHKSQGKTFERIIIDLGKGAFAHGQVYVALSRCTTLDGIRLNSIVRDQDLICDSRILEFEESYNLHVAK